MRSIGSAEEYVVRIEQTTAAMIGIPGTVSPLYDLPFSAISWQRVENAVSVATVDVSNDMYGNTCCPYPLHGWLQALAIYRNGELVWWGPIVGWHSLNSTVQIIAHDVFAFLQRAVIISDLTVADPPGVSITSILAVSSLAGNYTYDYFLPASYDPVAWDTWGPFVVERTYLGTALAKVWEATQSILGEVNGVATALGKYGMMVARGVQPTIASIDESNTLTRPQINVDCLNVASSVFVLNDSAGEGGFASTIDISVAMVESSTGTVTWADLVYPEKEPVYVGEFTVPLPLPLYISGEPRMNDASAVEFAYPEAMTALAPKVTLESIQLAPNFGEGTRTDENYGGTVFDGINSLVPGRFSATWRFQTSCMSDVPTVWKEPNWEWSNEFVYSTKIEACHLVQLDVTVAVSESGLSETVMASFLPTPFATGKYY